MHYIAFKKLKLIHLLEDIHIKVCLTSRLYAVLVSVSALFRSIISLGIR